VREHIRYGSLCSIRGPAVCAICQACTGAALAWGAKGAYLMFASIREVGNSQY